MATQYFRIDGADTQSGQETYLVLRAESKPHAERLARKQGILVSSVRIAKSTDWKAAGREGDSATALAEPGDDAEEPNLPPSGPVPQPLASAPAAPIAPPSSAQSRPHPSRSGPTAAAILISFVGAALVIGGVLALSLALWPDDGVRNELQQVDFRLHELSQTILGSMLVLGGLLLFVLSAVLVLVRARIER